MGSKDKPQYVTRTLRFGQVWYAGQPLNLWDSYGLSKYKLGAGFISEDARDRWHLNVTVKIKKPTKPSENQRFVGIDLETKLAVAQRARNKRRVQAIHAKIANRRRDVLHKLSTSLVAGYGAIR